MMKKKTKKTEAGEAAKAAAAATAVAGAEPETEAACTGEGAIDQLQTDLDRFKDLAHRSAADLDNLRRRTQREKQETVRYANTALLEKLLPIIDNFELGLSAARNEGGDSPILQGMAMVEKQLKDFLVDHGVEPIDAEGREFDPNLHEAMTQEESGEVPEGVVLRQIRKGYKLRDRLLRAAAVIVSKGKPSAD
jgi:molecular chaperone GrpE